MEATLSIDWSLVDDDDSAVSLQMALDVQNEQRTAMTGGADDAAMGEEKEEAEASDDSRQELDNSTDDNQGNDGDDFCRAQSHEMFLAPTGSADWSIAQILKRRRAKSVEMQAEDRHDPDYAEDLERQGEWMLLVEWAGAPPTRTWERRGWLLDQGYGEAVRAYERNMSGEPPTMPPKQSKRGPHAAQTYGQLLYRLRPYVPPDPEDVLEFKTRVRSLVAELRLSEAPLWEKYHADFRSKILPRPHLSTILHAMRFPTDPPYSWSTTPFGKPKNYSFFPIEEVVNPNSVELTRRLANWWKNDSLIMTQICPIGEPETLAKFYDRYVVSGQGTPIIALCHGTQRKFAPRIAAAGLRVPGERGVSVVNGSAYGVGIYSTCSPSYASGYARPMETGVMFICAGMCMKVPEINAGGRHVYVYYRSEFIVPILAARYQVCQTTFPSDYDAQQAKYAISDELVEKLRYPPPRVFASLEEMLDAPNEPLKAVVERGNHQQPVNPVGGRYQAPITGR